MFSKSKIGIVGAGLVGSLWAVILKRRGYDVTLFEKRSDIRKHSSDEARSINLIITSRGLNGLAEAQLLDEAISLCVPIHGRMIHSRSGELQYQPYGNSDECNFSISRSALNRFLISSAEKAGVKIQFDYLLEDINFESKTLHFFQKSQTFQYDYLFGTDGTGSLVRKNLCAKYPDKFLERTDWLDADYKELFLPANHLGQYQVEKNALHIWPRGSHMMMALANLDGSFTVTMYMPQNKFSELQSSHEIDQLFSQDFSDAIALMPDYASDFISNPQGKLGTVRCSKWTFEDSVILMGDAAHGIVPFFGQGMNSGFEDCLNFLKILNENQNDFSKTVTNFEFVQKPNAEAIADMALENWIEMRDKVGDPKFLLRKKIEALLEKEFPDIYKSRYAMVTYTLIPYYITQRVGLIQDKILNSLISEVSSVEEVSLEKAKHLLHLELVPFIKSHNLNFDTDTLVSKMKARNFF